MGNSSQSFGSSSTSQTSGRSWTAGQEASGRGVTASVLARCARSVRFVAFWAAVVLPCYAVWLLFGGLSAVEVPLFAAAVLFDCCALVVGHDHRTPSVVPGRSVQ